MTLIEAVKTEKESYLSNFGQLEADLSGKQPSWVPALRQSAMTLFAELGFPSTREEEWKYTNVAPIAKIPFKLGQYHLNGITRRGLDRLPFGNLNCPRLVFINGLFSAKLSRLAKLPRGVQVKSLAEALQSEPELVEAHLGRYARSDDHAFNALNTAFLRDGAFIYVPQGVTVPVPLHLLFLSAGEAEPTVSHPRNLIIAESSSQVSIVEHYAGLHRGVYFTNPVTEMVVGENSSVRHYKIQNEETQAFHVATVQAYAKRSGNYLSHSISLGGGLVRNNLTAVLDGEGADCLLYGLYLLQGRQHLDNHTGIEHARPHCTSREVYKGILEGRSRGVFHGRILVRPHAQKTDSKQTNKNLLLSDDALVNTTPQLEIYADDVKCTHGATIGQLDKDALFYLRSRGIAQDAARSILIYAFASEIVRRIEAAAVQSEMDRFLFERLPKGYVAKEAVPE